MRRMGRGTYRGNRTRIERHRELNGMSDHFLLLILSDAFIKRSAECDYVAEEPSLGISQGWKPRISEEQM